MPSTRYRVCVAASAIPEILLRHSPRRYIL
jgi:hypothetical protein